MDQHAGEPAAGAVVGGWAAAGQGAVTIQNGLSGAVWDEAIEEALSKGELTALYGPVTGDGEWTVCRDVGTPWLHMRALAAVPTLAARGEADPKPAAESSTTRSARPQALQAILWVYPRFLPA